MPTPDPIPFAKSRRRILGFLIPILVALIALAAIAANAALRRSVEQSEHAEVLVLRLHGLSYRLSALEWQAIAEQGLSSEISEKAQSVRDEMDLIMEGMEQLDPGAETLRLVRETYEAYVSAINEEFRLIASGDLDQARLVDEGQVDPTFGVLVQTLDSTSIMFSAKAQQAERVADLGFAVVLVLATAVLALLFWQFQRARSATESAGVEHAALVRRQEDLRLLSEMGNWLRACLTVAEAYEVFANSAQRLFPNESGALYIFHASRNLVEAATTWGEFPTHSSGLVLSPDECWALRRGQAYVVADTSQGFLCQHVGDPKPASYLCVPMMAQGETLGFLHLRLSKSPQTSEAGSSYSPIESKRQLAVTMAEHVALALMNLRLQDTLREQAIRDPLTGLFNRRYMEETLERELGRAARREASVGVVMLDIDRFKLFNDTFGHAAGDTVMIQLSALLQAHIRGEDIPCRYGGEEFVLVLPEASPQDAVRRAEQLRVEVQRLSAQHRGQSLGAITVSLGVAIFPEHGATVEGLLDAADAALYRAKAEGRNRLTVAQASGG